MDSTSLLITVAIVAWCLQIALSFFQMKAFNATIQSMANKGQVKIGRSKSRWKARTVVVVALSDEQKIVDAQVMNGVSVFARPKPIDEIVGGVYPFEASRIKGLRENVLEALNVAFQTDKTAEV